MNAVFAAIESQLPTTVVGILGALIALASAIIAAVPAPIGSPTTWYGKVGVAVWKAIDFVALNFANGKTVTAAVNSGDVIPAATANAAIQAAIVKGPNPMKPTLVAALALGLGMAATLSACNSQTAVDIIQVTADASAVAADLVVAEQQIQAACPSALSCSVPPSALTTISNAVALVNSDLATLKTSQSATAASVVLSDINEAIQVLAPYAPAIEALIGTLAAPAEHSHMALVSQGVQGSIQADYTKLKQDMDGV